jgi:hypothetical protein
MRDPDGGGASALPGGRGRGRGPGRRERAGYGYGAGAGLHHEEGARVVASLNHHEADGAEGEVGVRSNC